MIDKKRKKKRNNTANGPFAWVCFDDETNDKKQIQVMFLIMKSLILVLKNDPTRKLTKQLTSDVFELFDFFSTYISIRRLT